MSRCASTPRHVWPMPGKRTWPGGGTPVRSWPGPRRSSRCCSRRRPSSIATCWSSTGPIMMRPWAGCWPRGAAEEAQRLAAALYFFWYTRGLFVTGLRWLRAALAAEGRSSPWCGCVPRSGWRSWLSSLATTWPRSRPSSRHCRRPGCSVTMWCWPAAWRPRVTSGGSLDPERSAALFEEGLEAAHRSGDGWTRSTGLAGLGWARYFAGSFDAAAGPLAGGYPADGPLGAAAAVRHGRARPRRG